MADKLPVRVEETQHGPALDNGLVRVEVHLTRGTYDVLDGTGRRVISDAAASVRLSDGTGISTRGESLGFTGARDLDDAQGKGTSLFVSREDSDDGLELHLLVMLYEGAPFVVVQAEAQNTAAQPVQVQQLRPLDRGSLDIGAPARQCRFYKHGYQSWSPTTVLRCDGEDIVSSPPVVGPGTQPGQKAGRFLSELMTAVVDPATDRGVVAGFVSAADQLSHVWLDRDAPHLTAASYGDGVAVGHRQTIASERLMLEPTDAPLASLCSYGDALGREMDALTSENVTSGWCSWYYYWQGVNDADVMANLEFLANNRDALPVEYVQIDDGYQAEIGDWLTANEKFPHGMKWLADEIHARGFKAGIWVAPFLAGARSRLFQDHADWFVRFSTGGPAIATMNWGQLCYALDLTHPAVQAWLKDTFRTICDDWGYDYVKIDFIYAGAVDGVRHDPNVTRAQAYRRGVQTIRDAVGDRFILACGNPQGPSAGLVDGSRVGPDVAPYWLPFERQAPRTPLSDPSALNSIRNSINRFWMHGRLWMNDPDCLLVRDTDGALTIDEVRSLATVIGMTGGMVLSSDNLTRLSAARRDLVSLLLPVYGRSAVPLDLFQSDDLPQVLELECGTTHKILALFNWQGEEITLDEPLPDGNWHAFELWREEYLGPLSDLVSVTIPPHGCRLVRLSRTLGRPQVVGSTLHLLQGALEIAEEEWDGAKLRALLRPVAKKDGALYVWRDGAVESVIIEGLREERVLEIQ
jgi:alpha-galactosidase